ncbi:hypothetical protein NP233_g133 [Leucocoprinus birnbaumii]|uniref:Uncharacterized protein n=1 Tax=Leucocoprinus birnbaumii TaxID=56174 RepID=A0AAD5Z0G2_9AGAR|nr:hypothetical protein NP233_g133 [Leucocoprinus birnbaumii]
MVSTIPGGTSTVVDTVTITVPVTSTEVTTLWGSSCSANNPNTSPTSTPTDTPTPTPTPTLSTPPPSIIVTSSSSTEANGNVTPVVQTITSTVPPVLVTPTGEPGPVRTSSDRSRNLGPIIGGVVGGVAGLGALILLILFFIRRRQRWDDIFDTDDVPVASSNNPKKEKLVEAGPKPYHYGLVGHTKSPSLSTPPASPPPSRGGPTTLLDGGADRSHNRNTSTTPLLGPAMNPMGRPSTSPSSRPPSSRPPSTGSPLGFGSQVEIVGQGQMWDPNGLYNAPSQPQPQRPGSSSRFSMGAVGPMAAMMGRSDGDHRTGSPVSFQERRILQVTNADLLPQSPQTPGVGSSSLDNRLSVDPQRDGKGRIISKGEKAPIVHLDGGRFQEDIAGSSSSAPAGPAPPAYSA